MFGAADVTAWQYWWAFNREPYLRLKSHIYAAPVTTGNDGFSLGRGERTFVRERLRPTEPAIRGLIVPALLHALDTETQNDIVTAAMVALAKIGDAENATDGPRMADVIKKFLGAGSQEVAETAAVSLGILANPADTDLLVALAEDDAEALARFQVPIRGHASIRSRTFAAYGLGLIGQGASHGIRARVNNACAHLLDGVGRTLGTRDLQVGCMMAMRLTPLPIDPADKDVNGRVTATLVTRQHQIRWLLAYYDDPQNDAFMRAHAPSALARLVAEAPQDFPLRAVVADRLIRDLGRASKAENMVQQSCVLALGEIGCCDEDPVNLRIQACLIGVQDNVSDQQAKRLGLIALGRVGGRPGKVGNWIHGVTAAAPELNLRTFLANQLTKGRGNVPQWAALAIAVMERGLDDSGAPSSAEMKTALRCALADAGSPDEFGAFAIAVGIAHDQESREILRKHLDRLREGEARGYTALALGLIEDVGAVTPIQEVVKQSKFQPDLLRSAAIALGLLGDKQLVPELITMLRSAQGLASQASVCSALGFIGDARSIDPLIGMLQNQEITAVARSFAAVALGIVADKEPLPWNSKISVDVNYCANTATLSDGQAGILDIL
jgi:HEAT repeat protein